VRDGHPVRVSPEIAKYVSGPAKGRFRINLYRVETLGAVTNTLRQVVLRFAALLPSGIDRLPTSARSQHRWFSLGSPGAPPSPERVPTGEMLNQYVRHPAPSRTPSGNRAPDPLRSGSGSYLPRYRLERAACPFHGDSAPCGWNHFLDSYRFSP